MRKISSLLLVFVLSACSSSPKKSSNFSEKTFVVYRPIKNKYVITQRFKPKKNRKHKGLDIAGKKNDPILAMADGKVLYRGSKFSGYGKMILIEHAYGISSLYSHLSKILVRAGDRVKGGQIIGLMGRTGRATGIHLHFEVMENKEPVNPEKYIKF